MAPLSKKNDARSRKTIKMTPGQANVLNKALDDLEAHYGDVLASWDKLSE